MKGLWKTSRNVVGNWAGAGRARESVDRASQFDGFSIGSNDLTQLVLGIDRDSEALAPLFDERNEAVTTMIRSVIEQAHRSGREVGLCGQAPSDHPDFARLLVEAGIDSISVAPDSFRRREAAHRRGRGGHGGGEG